MKSYGIKRNKPLLYEEVVNGICEFIEKEGLNPSDKLPSERELTESLGVSRNVLREAFHILEMRGIIYSVQGKGRFLRPLIDKELLQINGDNEGITRVLGKESLKEVYEVRQALECRAIELIVKNASEKDIEELEEMCSLLEKQFYESNVTMGEFKMHRLYSKKSRSIYMEEMLDQALNKTYDMMYSKFDDVRITHNIENEIKSHKAIVKAIKQRNASLASSLMYLHLQETIDILK